MLTKKISRYPVSLSFLPLKGHAIIFRVRSETDRGKDELSLVQRKLNFFLLIFIKKIIVISFSPGIADYIGHQYTSTPYV